MKIAPLAAAFLLAVPFSPALAVVQSEAPAALSTTTPIATLMANDAAKAVVLRHLPGLDQHPAYNEFKGMSLVALKPWSQGQITDEILANIAADLAALG